MITGAIKIKEAITSIMQKAKRKDTKLDDFKNEIGDIRDHWKTEEGADFALNLEIAIAACNFGEVLRLCTIHFEAIEEEIHNNSNY